MNDIIPTRVTIALMMFSAVFVNYIMRTSLSVSIVSMVPAATPGNNTNVHEPETLGWSAYERGLVLSAYYYAYIVANLSGGPVSEHYGPRLVMLVTTLASVMFTMLTPAAAKLNYLAMVIIRIAHGFCGGFLGPSLQALISLWAVTNEKGKFVGIMVAGTSGTVVAWSLCGVIIEAYGWEWTFYIFGIVSLLWCSLWWYLVYDTPQKHPRISCTERKFIIDGTPGIHEARPKTPYRQILTSLPVLSVTAAQFGSAWGAYFVLNAAPMFLTYVLNFDLATTGLLSSMVFLVSTITAYLFGALRDMILRKKLLSVRMLRKLFIITSHMIPAILVLSVTFTRDSVTVIALMTLSMASHGSLTASITSNPHDLSPNFAGSVFGLVNCGGTLAGIVTPMVVAHFTKADETNFETWQAVFYTGAGVSLVTGGLYMLLGSTDIQPWNYTDQEESKCDDKQTSDTCQSISTHK